MKVEVFPPVVSYKEVDVVIKQRDIQRMGLVLMFLK